MVRTSRAEIERRLLAFRRLVEIGRALSSALNPEELLDTIVHAVAELTGAERCSILLVDPDGTSLRFAAASGEERQHLKGIEVPIEGSIAGLAVRRREPILVQEGNEEENQIYREVEDILGLHTRSLLAVPMLIHGHAVGVLEALNKSEGERFDAEDVEILEALASHAAVALENARLISEQRTRLAEVLILQDISATLSRLLDLDRLLDQMLTLLQDWLGYHNCAVMLYEERSKVLRIVAHRGYVEQVARNELLALGSPLAVCRAAREQRVIHISQIELSDEQDKPCLSDTRSLLAVPMLLGEQLVGVIGMESPEEQAFGEQDVRILSAIADQAAVTIRQVRIYEDLRRANEMKSAFIATMSHELRTPMTVIISALDMILQEALGSITDAQRKTAQMARERAEILLHMLNDILDFSKLSTGDLEIRPFPIELRPTVEFMVERYRPFAERKGQTIEVEYDPTSGMVMADDERVCQVLGHLLSNAIKFSPDETMIRVRVAPYADDPSFVRVDVIDQGIGIRPDNHEVIFEAFRQLDQSFTRKYGGIGLGLALVKRLIELQGGVIWVESEEGQGSTFSFILPKADKEAWKRES